MASIETRMEDPSGQRPSGTTCTGPSRRFVRRHSSSGFPFAQGIKQRSKVESKDILLSKSILKREPRAPRESYDDCRPRPHLAARSLRRQVIKYLSVQLVDMQIGIRRGSRNVQDLIPKQCLEEGARHVLVPDECNGPSVAKRHQKIYRNLLVLRGCHQKPCIGRARDEVEIQSETRQGFEHVVQYGSTAKSSVAIVEAVLYPRARALRWRTPVELKDSVRISDLSCVRGHITPN